MDETIDRRDDTPTRSGYIALVGRPNAGKSTLMNALVGEKLSIVSPRAQTTWQRVTGIRTTETSQMVFLDTPGLLEVSDLHQRAMLEAAHEALREAEVTLLLLDPTRPLDETRRAVVLEALDEGKGALVVAVNKVDAADSRAIEGAAGWAREALGVEPLRISAVSGAGLDELVDALESRLPPGPFYYPVDEVAIQPVRFFVTELIREVVFEQYGDEIPWAVAAQIEEFREAEDPVYIAVTLFVERESQKGILIGKGGRAIRRLGTEARARIETFLQRRVYLDLWVKPLVGWRRKGQLLTRLGYRLPEVE